MWKIVWKILGAISAISVGGTVLWAVFAYTDNIKDFNSEINQKFDKVIKSDSIKTTKVDTIMVRIKELNSNYSNLNENVKNLSESHRALMDDYIHRLSETLTTQEFLQVMENLGLDLKKKSIESLGETVLEE